MTSKLSYGRARLARHGPESKTHRPSDSLGVAQSRFDQDAARCSSSKRRSLGGGHGPVHDMRARLGGAASDCHLTPLYRESDIAEPLQSVRRVTKSLGAVRDADVFIAPPRGDGCQDSGSEQERLALAYYIAWGRPNAATTSRDAQAPREPRPGSPSAAPSNQGPLRVQGSADIIAPFGWLAEECQERFRRVLRTPACSARRIGYWQQHA